MYIEYTTCTYTYMYVQIYTAEYMNIDTCTCIHDTVHKLNVHMYICICNVYVYVYVDTCKYINKVCVVNVHVCMCMYIHSEIQYYVIRLS